MTKILDLIRRGMPIIEIASHETPGQPTLPPPKEILDAPKIECSNIAEYMYVGTSQEYWDMGVDFPNLAPPFPMFWMEWRVPTKSNSNGKIVVLDSTNQGLRVAALFLALSVKDYKLLFGPTGKDNRFILNKLDEYPTAKWILNMSFYFASRDSTEIILPKIRYWIMVGAQGEFIEHGFTFQKEDSEPSLKLAEEIKLISRPALLAICFMHCKNVIVNVDRIDEALQNRTIKRHGVPLTVYKVLNIEPMKTVLKAAVHGSTDIKRALNICRGHFKDYRESAGLFGRVKGLWWWESHVRGSAEQGISEHDYNVKAPKNNRQVCS